MPAENRTLNWRAESSAQTDRETAVLAPEPSVPDAPVPSNSIPRRAPSDHVPLSFAQQRLWFLDQLYPQLPLYNFPVALRIEGQLDREALQLALSHIIARHEVLRTRFIGIEGNPVQIISSSATVELPVTDLSGVPDAAREQEAHKLLVAEAGPPFDLAQDLMVRCLLLKLGEAEHILMVTIHHIATDGWSVGIFFRELAVSYAAFHAGAEPDLPELPIQYADYAVWQREWLRGETLQKQLAYWKDRLAGAKDSLELPLDRPRPPQQTFSGTTLVRPMRRGLMDALKKVSQRAGVTPFMTFLAAYKTLLFRYSRQDDVSVGIPIAGRNRFETEGSIGFFVNTLVARTDLSGNPTFLEVLRRVRDVTFDAFEHQDLPFEKLVAELHPERNASLMPLIQAVFVLQKAPTEGMELAGLKLTPVEVGRDVAKFDLTFFIEERGQDFLTMAEYNTDLFDESTITRLLGHWEHLLEGIVADPSRRLSDLPIMAETERRQVLVEWNRTQTEYPREKCIHDLFAEQAKMRPAATAILFGGKKLTYGELDARANQLAHHLLRSGAAPGQIVGVCIERSVEMIVALLGILKAGCAYASLDPASPSERFSFMLEDLRAPVWLTQQKFQQQFPTRTPNGLTPKLICLDSDWDNISRQGKETPGCNVPPTSLAYVSYTSGSTGRPKGVCVPHRGVVRLVRNTNYARFDEKDIWLQMAPVSFDASTLEIWGSLLNGAALAILPPQIPSLSDIGDAIRNYGVTSAWFTSGLFNQMVESQPESMMQLHQILSGGDVLSPAHVKKALNWPGARRLINGYGPTENTTFTACYEVPRDFDGQRSVPIGRPIANTQCYILDDFMQPVPVGVTGELYTGGDGLAAGYLNQPALTAEKFVANPFESGRRLYRTGDLARFLPDGNIEFLGRKDLQVKIRGFRVEPGEVETALAGHPAVRECAVAPVDDPVAGKRLVAWFTSRTEPGPTSAELRDFLKTKLPEYMIPSAFVPLATMPLTSNDKLDRRALPMPEAAKPDANKSSARPEDEIETELTAIWEGVLGVKPIGPEDKFFELGGHSLLAVRLLAQVEKKFGCKIPLAVVFEAQTVRQMATRLREKPDGKHGSSVIEVQSGGSRPPIFFVHGVGGGMFWGYTNLARSLGQEQPVMVLKSRAMDGRQELERIEEMAAQYVADIRAMQPKGPYYLGGYCFGGNVAYEMARQLTAAGEKVAFLALLNCAPPNSSYGKFRWTPVSAYKFARNLCRLLARTVSWEEQERKSFVRWKTELVQRKVKRLFNTAARGAYPIEVDEMVDLSSFPADQRKLWETHIRALLHYFPKPYDGKVTLLRSRGHPMFCSYDRHYGWGELAREVELLIVPGAHESILEEPHVRVLATELKKSLLRAQEEQAKTPSPTQIEAKKISSNGRVSDDQWNETRADYPRELCVHQLFEEQVRRTPDAPAIIYGAEKLTYAELNRRANQLAHHLETLGVGPDVPVAISLERSIELFVGLLGILKAGGAYVSLDPAYPRERLAMMLENSRAPLLLTQQKFAGNLPVDHAQGVLLDEPLPAGLRETNPTPRAASDNLAYVIYTSGSTGKPKGVAMEHRPLVNLIWWQLKNSQMGNGDRTLQFASPSFDVSFQEMFSTWSSGGALIIVNEDTRHDPRALLNLLAKEKVNRLFLPFIALNQLAESATVEELRGLSLREIVTAGEQLRITGKISALFETLPGCSLHNHYGPSESHVVTAYTMTGAPSGWTSLPPIGRPIANTQIHLLDEKLNPVAQGESGELYIGGDCLARGYLHRADLTAERFVPDPFRLEPSARLYKTGDLARRLPDGNIEFLGRIDHQVKIRGYRIELSEIEAVLGQYSAVRECAVTAHEDAPGQKRLVGYVVPQPGQNLTVSELRSALLTKLPDYMVPATFLFLEALPLTPSGKVNRKALPAPDQNRPQLGGEFVSASNETEARIAGIWSEVLNLKQVGARDNFFELGGHSLSAAQVVSRMREAFKVEMPVSCLFEAPTVAALADGIANRRWAANGAASLPLKRMPRDGNPPVSFTQARLWFIDRMDPDSPAYNVPSALRLRGVLDVKALQSSLDRIARRHESLRTSISFAGGALTQVIALESSLKLSVVDLTSTPEPQRTARAREALDKVVRQPFDLSQGPLVRCALVKLGEQEHIFVVVMHHIISDGWSLGVFFKELDLLYHAHAAGKLAPILPGLPVQYADYALWQQQWLQGPVLNEQIGYWREKLKGAPLMLELPLDNPPQPEPAGRAGQAQIILSKDLGERIQALGRKEGVTPFMVLLAALSLTLQRWTEQSDMVIGTVVAGRNRRELENLIGCFMNFLPLRVTLNEDLTGREFMEHVKAIVLEAQSHQECPFEKIVETINPERRLAENPLYNVALLMQNYPTSALNSKDLSTENVPVDLQAALLDLRFIAEESAAGFSVLCEYKPDLFTGQTIQDLLASFNAILSDLLDEPAKKLDQYSLLTGLAAQARAAKEHEDRQTIAVVSTFTAEPVDESLKFWMQQLEIPARIEFAGFNQVFQQLLDPTSLLSLNQRGLNVIFARLEDWEQLVLHDDEADEGSNGAPSSGNAGLNGARFHAAPEASASVTAAESAERLRRNVQEFIAALKSAAGRGSAPYLVCLCQPSQAVTNDPARAALHLEMEKSLSAELSAIAGAYLVTAGEIMRQYPVEDFYDENSEEVGAIPFTPAYYAVLGTIVARKFQTLRRPAFKVIVLDCDETLWTGVCGEDGPAGIKLDASRRALQEFMLAQRDAGMLLCVCSKNNEEDVEAVFATHPEMPIKREHLAAWRINWQPKSANLKSLAAELRLGLDSFIFVDDNPVECAEVSANCPEVLTLQLPESPDKIPQFIKHCWAFDHLKISAEDRQRNASYQQERAREQLRSQSMNLRDFLAGLDLKIDIAHLAQEQVTRASQLSLRTNQFNFTTRRWTETDMQTLLRSNRQEILTVSVKDRFGWYGLVGVTIHEPKSDALEVNTFLLSCRVLGRGVECQMIRRLGQAALARGLAWVDLQFIPSEKNRPAFNFLEKMAARFRQVNGTGSVYRLPAEFAAGISADSGFTEEERARELPVPVQGKPATPAIRRRKFNRYGWIAQELNDPALICGALDAKFRLRPRGQRNYTAARTETEKLLCKIWAELLRAERVGLDDNFFELGGHSLLAVRLFAEIERQTGRKLPLVTVFQSPTVRELAEALSQQAPQSHSSLVPVRAQGTKSPLFLIHGAGGDVLWGYANLAPYLDEDLPVYGVKSRALDGSEEFENIEAMAAHYITQIQSLQPEGPYFLGGYCFGGNVAYEMARQLEAQGEKVELLALLDSAPSNTGYEKLPWWRPSFLVKFSVNFYFWLEEFVHWKSEERRAFFLRKGRTWSRKIIRKLMPRKSRPQDVDMEEVIDLSKFPPHELRLWQIHLQHLVRERFQPYNGRAVLFRTKGQPLFCSLEEDFGWTKLLRGGLDVRMIAGSHESIFMEPNVRELASQLNQCMARPRSKVAATNQNPVLQTT